MWHYPSYFWRVRLARKLRRMGQYEAADDVLGITEEKTRAMHDRQAREAQQKAERRARRRRTLIGRVLNFLQI